MIIIPMIAPALRNTVILPERVSLWFIWLFFMLHSFLYCSNNRAIDQRGSQANYHHNVISFSPRLCKGDIYNVSNEWAEQDNSYFVNPFHGSDFLNLLHV